MSEPTPDDVADAKRRGITVLRVLHERARPGVAFNRFCDCPHHPPVLDSDR